MIDTKYDADIIIILVVMNPVELFYIFIFAFHLKESEGLTLQETNLTLFPSSFSTSLNANFSCVQFNK